MLKRAIVIGCLVLLAVGLAWGAEDSFQMPADMQKLLPADPVFIAAATSVKELDRQWRAIEEMWGDDHGEKTDMIALISEELPRFEEYADLDRPLAVAMGLPQFMAEGSPPVTVIIPLKDSLTDELKQEMREGKYVHFFEGDYVAFSLDPEFSPAGVVPDLAGDLSAGFVSGALDLETIIGAYRPLAEMGLGAMANAPASPDSAAVEEDQVPTGMDPEEVAAMQDMARSLMDSARGFDMALRIEGETLTLHTGFSAHPGSVLDPGPQPDFEHALQLTRMLPAGGDILQVMALDQTKPFKAFKGFYTASIDKAVADMPPEQGEAYRAWMESYLDSIDLFANPLAASIRMTDEAVTANMVMECPDAPAALERFAALFEGLSAIDLGIGLKKMPTGKVAGVEVRSWTITLDAEKMAEQHLDAVNPHLAGRGRMEAEQMVAILRKVTPSVNMATRGDYLIFSADPNTANLAHMIQFSGQKRGAAIPEIAALAAKAGPFCQQVVTGDLMSILTWVTEWMEELEEEEYTVVKGNPIPFSSAYTVEGADYGVDWTMDMPAVRRLAEAFEEMEARHDNDDDEDDMINEEKETE